MSSDTFAQFLKIIKQWLTQLDLNSQLFVALMKDEALPVSARALAVGVLLYLKMPLDLIADKLKILGLVDDVIVMIVGLALIVPQLPADRLAYYRRTYEAVAQLDDYERVMRATLGVLWERLVVYVERLRHWKFKQKSAEEVAQSESLREELFDETMIFVANLGLDPATVDSGLHGLPSPEKMISLLGSGLEEAQREKKKSSPILSGTFLSRLLPARRGNGEPAPPTATDPESQS